MEKYISKILKKPAKLLYTFFLIPGPLFGAIFHVVDTTNSLKCTLSSNHHNRIVVDGGFVNKVICSSDTLSINTEPESGQAFVYSLIDNPEEAVISVVTNSGQVQDIEISFQRKPPEVIILSEQEIDEIIEEDPSELNQLVTMDQIVDDLLKGQIPAGYCAFEIERVRNELKRGLFVESVTMLGGLQDEIYVYEVINDTCRTQQITEKELEGSSSCWIYLQNKKIKPYSKTVLIISYNKEF